MITFTSIASSSSGNCYHVTDGQTPLLLECGIGFKRIQKSLNFQVTSLAGCLVSHEHGDHSKAVRDMLKAGVDVYMSSGTHRALFPEGTRPPHGSRLLTARDKLTIGTWTVLPFDTVHDAAEPLGFLLSSGGEKFLFATDTAFLKYRFKGLTHIAIECNHQLEILKQNVDNGAVPYSHKARVMKSHFNLANVLKCLAANDLSAVREIYLLHLSDANSNEGEMKTAVQAATGKPVTVCAA